MTTCSPGSSSGGLTADEVAVDDESCGRWPPTTPGRPGSASWSGQLARLLRKVTARMSAAEAVAVHVDTGRCAT